MTEQDGAAGTGGYRGAAILTSAIVALSLLSACFAGDPVITPESAPPAQQATVLSDTAGAASATPSGVAGQPPATFNASVSTPSVAPLPQPVLLDPSTVFSTLRFRIESDDVSLPDGGAPFTQTTRIEGIQQSADNAYGYNTALTTTVQTLRRTTTFRLVMVDEQAAVQSDSDWFVLDRQEFNGEMGPGVLMVAPFSGTLPLLVYLGDEVLDGLATRHFQVAEPISWSKAQDSRFAHATESISATVDLWLAADGDYPLQMRSTTFARGVPIIDDMGNNQLVNQTTVTFITLFDLGSAPPVAWPAEAPAPDEVRMPGFEAGEFPVPPGAIPVTELGELLLFSDLSLEDAVEFYRSALTKAGWQVTGEWGYYTATKERMTLNLAFVVTGEGVQITVYGADASSTDTP